MQRALEISLNATGNTASNPLVGAVIVFNDKIIGEGYHRKYGEAHAEVNAVNTVKERDLALLQKATMYVTLEPCSHYGKTPPCAEFIVKSGIKRVVVAMLDPNKEVNGRGVRILENAGIEVITGVLEDRAREINRRFITFHTKKRPYIVLKWAESVDGFIAPIKNEKQRSDKGREAIWITSPLAKRYVHRMRGENMAIMVGKTTLLEDNPSLDCRAYKMQSPIKITFADARVLENIRSFNIIKGRESLLLVDEKLLTERMEDVAKVDGLSIIKYSKDNNNAINRVFEECYKRGISSIMVEGGSILLESFLRENLYDEVIVFKGEALLGAGVKVKYSRETVKNLISFNDRNSF